MSWESPIKESTIHYLPNSKRPKASQVCSKCDYAANLLKQFPRALLVAETDCDHYGYDYMMVQPVAADQVLIRLLETSSKVDTRTWKSVPDNKLTECQKSWAFYLACVAHQSDLVAIVKNPKLIPWNSTSKWKDSLGSRICSNLFRLYKHPTKEDDGDSFWRKEVFVNCPARFKKFDDEMRAALELKRAKAERQTTKLALDKQELPLRNQVRDEIKKLEAKIDAKMQEIKELQAEITEKVKNPVLGPKWCTDCKHYVRGGCSFCGCESPGKYICESKQQTACASCAVNKLHLAWENNGHDFLCTFATNSGWTTFYGSKCRCDDEQNLQ